MNDAVEWFIRLNAESCAPDDLRAFEHWLQQNPAHRTAYEEITRRKNLLKRATAANENLRHAALSYRPGKKSRAFSNTLRLATAASVFLLVGIATFSAEGWYGTSDHLVVGHGNQETVHLADGSRLELNTDSEVKIRINRWQRSVELIRGEVYFNVVHDQNKPFVVTAGSGRTIDLGTQFDVYRHTDGEVIIAVQEGSVRVTANQTKDLSASQAISYDANGEFTETANGLEPDTLLAWRRGKLIFDNRRLDEALNELCRYHNVRVHLAQAELGEQRISGTFPIDRLESNLAVIAQGLGLKVRQQANGQIVIANR